MTVPHPHDDVVGMTIVKDRYYLLFIVHMIIMTFESSLALLRGELFAFSGRFMWRFSGLCTLDFGTKMNFNPTFFSRKRANQAKLPSAIFTDVSLLKVCHITHFILLSMGR